MENEQCCNTALKHFSIHTNRQYYENVVHLTYTEYESHMRAVVTVGWYILCIL